MRAHLVVKKTLQALLAVVARPINEPQAASAERRDGLDDARYLHDDAANS